MSIRNSLLPNHKSSFDKKLDLFFENRLNNHNLNLINTLPLYCHKKLLVILANSFDINIDGLDEKEARELIHFNLHLYKGTAYSLNRALNILFHQDIKAKEWFTYSGEPYYFKVQVKVDTKAITKEFYEKLEKAIDEYKNVRSILEKIVISTKVKLGKKYALATLSGEAIKVEPLLKVELKTKAIKNYSLAYSLEERININLTIGENINE